MKILLVDDHPIVLEALSSILRNKYPTTEIECVQDLPTFKQKFQPDSHWDGVIVDLNFYGEFKGFDLITTVKTAHPSVPVIVLSMHVEPAIIKKSLSLGANAYVTKTESPSEIFKAFEEVHAGRIYISQASQTALNGLVAADSGALTKREQEIAKMVILGETSKSIGEKLSISSRTVETHRTNILKKLGAKNTVQLIGLLRGN